MTSGLHPSRLMLPNGVTLVAKQTRKTPAVTMSLAFAFGSVDDPPDAPGAMFLLSRVIDRGTASRSATDIADALDDRGISLSVSMSRQQLSISCTCLAVDFEPVLALLGDIVMSPACPDEELATRRAQVLTSLRQDEDNPATRAVEAFMALLYGADHPYGRRQKGTPESVEALTRERLLALHRARFGPRSLTAVVVGDVERARAEACVAEVFGDWSASTIDRVPVASPTMPSARRFVAVPMMNKAQADIVYGFPSLKRADPSYYAYVLMNNVLGQYGLGGRLADSIRERQGMAYYVSSAFDASTIEGPMLIRAGVAASNVERAVASIDEELQTLRKTGVTGRELAESRQFLTGSLPLSLETNAGIAAFLQNAEFFGLGLDHDRRLPTLLTMVTIDEVNAALQSLDPARATIVVAGPYQPA
ncbi:MAG TPA: pitrilysin family protein [Vicinamibacterales bacterium]|nr:pitrilysin family protein [Vicinamibacterales bacterium]